MIYQSQIVTRENWPESLSDGLVNSCKICGSYTNLDYQVDDEFWNEIVPYHLKRDVICIECFDLMASNIGKDLSSHLKEVQYVGKDKTIILEPKEAYLYETISTKRTSCSSNTTSLNINFSKKLARELWTALLWDGDIRTKLGVILLSHGISGIYDEDSFSKSAEFLRILANLIDTYPKFETTSSL